MLVGTLAPEYVVASELGNFLRCPGWGQELDAPYYVFSYIEPPVSEDGIL